MGYVTKVHGDDNGDKLVVESGGEIEIKEGGLISGLPQGTAIADSTASDVAGVVSDLNALLAVLRTAGFIASE